MPNILLIKNSATANAVPTGGQLANGEIAINYADGNLFFKDSGGSVQTLVSKKFVSVTGNITGGNVNTGILSATGNVQSGNLNAAGLSLSGNVVSALTSAANITTTANIAANFFIGNGSQLTGIAGGGGYDNPDVATFLANFGSNTVSTTGNVTTGNLTVNGNITFVNSNVVTINDKFINVANNAATSAAANGGGLGVGPVDAEYATLTFNNGTTAWNTNIPLSVNGNVAGNYFVGNGSALTSITGASVVGAVANATFAVSAGSSGSAVTAEQITFAVQANITGVGTLGNLSVSGNTTVGNLSTGGFVSATGNITGGNLSTGGFVSAAGNITGGNILGGANVNATTHTGTTVSVSGNIDGANVNATTHTGTTVSVTGTITGANITTPGLISATGTITGGNLRTAGLISATGNITGGNLRTAGSIVGILTTAGQNNITSVGTLTALAVTGNISSGNVSGTNIVGTLTTASQTNITSLGTLTALAVTGNISSGNLSGTSIVGTLTTGAQTNITSLGTLTALAVTGNTTVGNLSTGGFVSATGNVTATGTIKGASTIGVGNATPSTSGAGITFPATQSASSDANTLDDYEEGTFTPTVTFSGNAVGLTYQTGRRNGRYTKIGNRVYISINVELANKGSSSGSLNIEGLPFATENIAFMRYAAATQIAFLTGVSGDITASANANGTVISDFTFVGTGTQALITNTQCTNDLIVALTMHYPV